MKTFKKIWDFIGTSSAWLLFFLLAAIIDSALGGTLTGMFYTFICLIGFFLCRIAEAIEAISNRQ